MAICTLVAPFDQISGAIGGENGVVAMPDKFGRTLLRDNVIPDQPQSTYQDQINQFLTSASIAWSQLEASVREPWDTAAAPFVERGPLALEHGINGQALFIRVNMYRLMAGQAISTTAPDTTGSAGPSAVTIQSDGGDPQVTISRAVAPTAGFYQIRMNAVNLTPARSARVNEVRSISTVFSDAIVPITVGTSDQIVTPANPRFQIDAGDRRGIAITQLNADYVPVNGFFGPNIVATSL